ncbi:hypothetical protein HCH15_03515 [Corynebacterium testudinoris]|uniref:hypothetical protein n=1 Tax=Corynebacterium testudinoris TaxID=136857 RepID=UPI001C8BCABF|nr:hypothetical protein [Corynebacterium testudinoris]MBX8995253.1 hypothetical protein [Corynebacterium testudinoris]
MTEKITPDAGNVEGTSEGNSNHDDTASVSDFPTLISEHALELMASAISPSAAATAGVYSALHASDLPVGAEWIADRGGLPAIVFPMQEIDGTKTWQVKPRPGVIKARNGRPLKYIGPKKGVGSPPQLPIVRHGSGDVWIVEGEKQGLAAQTYAPDDVMIFRITGIEGWRVNGAPTPYLRRAVAGRRVVIFPDADAASNIRVYDGAAALGEAVLAAGGTSTSFVHIPGTGNQGLDDVLASIPSPEERRAELAKWVQEASAVPAALSKEALAKMRKRQRTKDAARMLASSADSERLDVVVDGDWHNISQGLARALVEKQGGREVFLRGDLPVEVYNSDEGLMLRALDRDGLHRRVLSAVRPLVLDREGNPKIASGIHRDLLGLVRGYATGSLPRIDRISTAPVVRADGTVVTETGFDPKTRTLVSLSADIHGLRVPDHPTDDEVIAAASLIRDQLFELDGTDGFDGWVFASESDRTHAVALLLTALIRSSVPTVPLALLDGVQRGVGKGYLVQVVHEVVYGGPAAMTAMPAKDEEVEKRITSDLMAGNSLVVLDEVMNKGESRLGSAALTAALTAPMWSGRVLGRSEMVRLAQRAVWVATGNNCTVPGDMARRVFTVRLSSDRPDLDERDNFRYSLQWVRNQRRQLLSAALTMIRAWYDRGQPEAPQSFGFVGFEDWQRIVGGVLHLGGFPDFLGTVLKVRREADSEVVDNAEHLAWVAKTAAGQQGRFTAKEILLARTADPDGPAPYGKSWDDLDARSLGRVWRQLKGRWFDGIRIVADGKAHGNARAWRVQTLAQISQTPLSTPAPAPPAAPAAPEIMQVKNPHTGVVTDHLRVMPEIDGPSITQLGGDDDG